LAGGEAAFSSSWLISESDGEVEAADPLLSEEDAEAQLPYTVVVAAAPGFAENEPEKYEALREAYQSEEIEQWFDSYIGGLKNTAFDIEVQDAWEDFQAEGSD